MDGKSNLAKTASVPPIKRMRRKQPKDSWPGRRTPDPKEAYSAVQLEEIGAIAIMWNAVDVMLDWLLKIAVKIELPFIHQIGR